MSLLDRFLEKALTHTLVRDTVTTSLLGMAGKGAGFLIPFFIATWFGVSPDTDAFFFAYALVIFMATIFSPVLESVVVPFVADSRAAGEDVGAFIGGTLGVTTLGLAALVGVMLLFIRPALAFFTRFTPAGLELVHLIMLEAAPLVVLIVWSSILAGTLNAYKVFSVPALSPAVRAVVTLAFIFFFKGRLGVHSIALGYVAGEVLRTVVLVYVMGRLTDVRLKFSSWKSPKVLHLFKTSSYQVTGMTALAFTPVINSAMASWVSPGSVSVLEYATRLYMIPTTFLGMGLVVVLLSHWSERYTTGGEEGLRTDVANALKAVGVVAVIVTIALLSARGVIVHLVYGGKRITDMQRDLIVTVFGLYLLGVTPYFLAQVYVRSFLVRK
ncbi:MAG: lipid II flippase MurJ, partial [Nitrospirota bacterium]